MSSITDQISSLMGKFDDMTNPYLSHLKNNQYVSAILYLLLILYAGLAAPRLPYSLALDFAMYTIKKNNTNFTNVLSNHFATEYGNLGAASPAYNINNRYNMADTY